MECILKLNSNIKKLVEAYDEIIGIQPTSNKTNNIEYLLSEVEYVKTIKRKQDRQQSNKEY